ncbi:Mu transposase C-terminal domain-containing protein [Trichocoleus sp. ST-U3]
MIDDLFVNDLIECTDESGNNFIERVLWIDEGYIIAFVFDIYAAKGFPQSKSVNEIREAISDGRASKLKSDPWARLVRDEELSDVEKTIRDKAWSMIEPLISSENEPSIYYRNVRGSLVKQVAQQHEAIERTIYQYLRRFWQRGKCKNALLPDYINSGGKGKQRKAGEKKRGRPRKYGEEPEIGIGINITEEDKRIFRIAINKFYNNPKQNSLTTAYELMIKEYYYEEIIYEDGIQKSELISPEKRPTLTQFKYWYEVEQDIRKTFISRKGANRYALQNRAIMGSSKMESLGPGFRFQIDATVADVYLVSLYNRSWIIGRPVIYVVIDVFSRMVVGVYVGLEGPSWAGAMMALANAATDKVQFCEEYGIQITQDDWPCHHIPDAILGDRGELVGTKVETLIPNLNIRVENAASYRADWKGLVERYFRTIHEYVKPFLPGYVDKDFRQRGARDYRLDGKLDLYQFTEIIIRCILHRNHQHYLSNYEREEMMIADDISPIPIELWKWGIANRSGRLRTFPEDIVKLNLMPTGKATITAKGIKFKGMYYTCEKARRELWFEKARSNLLSKSDKSLDISYDPRKPNFIYLRSPDGRDFEKCVLYDPEERYSNKDLHDIEYLLAYEELQKQKGRGKGLQEKVDLIAQIENVVSKAEKMAEAVQDDGTSNRQKVAGIRGNRTSEKVKQWELEGFELAITQTQSNSESVETQAEDSEKPKSLQSNHLDLLRKNRQERKRGQKQ